MRRQRIDLTGTWQAEGAGHRVPMAVPGDVHSALLAAGRIPDPYWGTNGLDLQPLNRADWVLTRRFEVDAALLDAPALYLHFDSIDTVDTVAEVRLNGAVVGVSDNIVRALPLRRDRAGARRRILDFAGAETVGRDLGATVAAGSAARLADLPLAELAPNRTTVFAVLDLEADGARLRNEHAFAPWKACALAPARVEARVVDLGGGRLAVDLATDAPAFYVSLRAAGICGEFDDNAVTLLPGEGRRLAFAAKGPAPSAARLQAALTVEHLRATYA